MSRKTTASLMIGLTTTCVALAAPPWVTDSRLGMVAADSTVASLAGAQMLAQGGNAFDAAVVTSLALAISRPESTGLGGGGFMVAYVAREKRVVVLDFRETAPATATTERYRKLLAEAGDGPSPTIYGGNAVAVPGQLAGLGEIHKRYCTRAWPEIISAIEWLPRVGFSVDQHYVDSCNEVLRDYEKWPQFKQRFGWLYRNLLGSGTPAKVQDRVKRPELAQALRLIANMGPDAMYKGPLGEAVVKAVQSAGGSLTMQDLANYRVRERQPLRTTFGEYEIASVPPPSSGGVCLIEALNILSATRVRSDLHPQQDRGHVLVEALKHAFADRARWLGDPDFCQMPIARLTSPAYARQLARRIQPGKTLPPAEYGQKAPPPEDGGTSHFCVVDTQGNVVAITETINGAFGSLVVAEPYGIILNNELDDFAIEAGKPNQFGLVHQQANVIAPGKRPLSSMTPTIVLKEKRPVLALGGSGGPRIISAVLQVLLNVIDRRIPLGEAIGAARLHHQWQPDEVYFDIDPPTALVEALKKVGHRISDKRKTAAVQAIQIMPDGTFVGGSDPRKGGRPAGIVE